MRNGDVMTADTSRGVANGCAARQDVTTIALDDGWSGEVLLRDPRGEADRAPWTVTLNDWRALLTALIRTPDAVPHRVVLKASRTAEVFRASPRLGGVHLDVVCKHSRTESWARRCVRRVRGSRERRNWDRAFMLLRSGIATATPLAIVERSRPAAEAWLVTQAITDGIDLDGVMSWQIYDLDRCDAIAVKRKLVERFVGLCTRMREAGIRHRDFKASNVLITDWRGDAEGPHLYLVDMDGLSESAFRGAGYTWRSITRLAASLADTRSFTRTDAARFLRGYLAADRAGKEGWKAVWLRLSRDVARYNRRAARRKRGKLDGFTA